MALAKSSLAGGDGWVTDMVNTPPLVWPATMIRYLCEALTGARTALASPRYWVEHEKRLEVVPLYTAATMSENLALVCISTVAVTVGVGMLLYLKPPAGLAILGAVTMLATLARLVRR